LKSNWNRQLYKKPCVAPRAGAWIEISDYVVNRFNSWVAPRAGAWIEIWPGVAYCSSPAVAPRAGAWIEIENSIYAPDAPRWSLPVRERGLKYRYY